MLRIGVHDDILVPSSTAAHPAPLQGTGEAAGAKARVGEGQTALHGLQRQPWLEKRSRFARAQSQTMGREQEVGAGARGTGRLRLRGHGAS